MTEQIPSLLANLPPIYTIGHSDQPVVEFVSLLSQYSIEALVDTRSHPVSRHCPQFDTEGIKFTLAESKVKYVFMGAELGGRPNGEKFYDEEGRVLYWKVAESHFFKSGLERLRRGALIYRLALMCSEEDPINCHRRLLISRALAREGYSILHIRRSGSVESEEALMRRADGNCDQMDMFSADGNAEIWKSTRSVLQRGAHLNFSKRFAKLK